MEKLFWYISFLVILLASCDTPSDFIRTKFIPNKKEGMIVGTLCTKKKIFGPDLYTLFFARDTSITRLVSSKETFFKARDTRGKFSISAGRYKPDFKVGKEKIFLFNIVKPAGKYNFFELELFYNSGAIQSKEVIQIDYPFEIMEGETKYIGELDIDLNDYIIRLDNEIERDRKYFNSKFPTIKF